MIEKIKNLTLLYIEDNEKIKDNYLKSFKILFKDVIYASNYNDAINLFKKNIYDLILIDIELKEKKDGFDIADKIREIDSEIPIVFLTGYNEQGYLLRAINSNINGYIIKPLDIKKLTSVLSNIFIKEKKHLIKFKTYFYNLKTYEVTNKNEKIIYLGKKENDLLRYFLLNKDRTLSREELENNVWPFPINSDTSLKNLISSLRKKFDKDLIINISKIGWRIKVD